MFGRCLVPCWWLSWSAEHAQTHTTVGVRERRTIQRCGGSVIQRCGGGARTPGRQVSGRGWGVGGPDVGARASSRRSVRAKGAAGTGGHARRKTSASLSPRKGARLIGVGGPAEVIPHHSANELLPCIFCRRGGGRKTGTLSRREKVPDARARTGTRCVFGAADAGPRPRAWPHETRRVFHGR
ncbi:hypothetical protein HPB52_005659 [Rhipicephalus sanguineus]|uniref:Secreted protein n=1 Tax=Rhipicephalus sanguineus TaxID=34632 RepID=A0A9D4QHI6_RHISA|nr:hypothetical protein HPB52_005659 [Rhipicephalus sanguineus]